jgi:hypothetical protein
MIKNFPLPTHMNLDTEFELINIVEKHILRLKRQNCAAKYLDIFNKYPNLKSFSISVFFHFQELEFFKTEPEKEKIDNELYQYLNEYKNTKEYEDFFYNQAETTITRENIEFHVSQAMEEMDEGSFQEWKTYQEKESIEKNLIQNKLLKDNIKQKI